MTGIICPQYRTGFYAPKRGGVPKYPSLWRNCIGAWSPCLGPTGLVLRDWGVFGKHGTLTNMDSGSDWVTSRGKYALDFDGSNDRVAIASMNLGTVHTISFWIKTTSTSFVAIGGDPGHYAIYHDGSTLYYSANLGVFVAVSNSTIRSGEWRHYAVMRQHASVSFWIDAIQIGTTQTLASNNALYLSSFGSYEAGNFAMAGQLDDIMFHTRSLVPTEIALRASRRGIAYELAPRRRSTGSRFNAAWARRQSQIIGGGLG